MTRSGHGAAPGACGARCAAWSSPPRRPAWLPHGALLPDEDWRWRHRAACLVLAAHLPVLLLWALLAEPRRALARPAAARRAAGRPRGCPAPAGPCARWPATLGLLTCSALVVHLADGATEAHFHFFVTVAVIALYQDWALYALALAFVLRPPRVRRRPRARRRLDRLAGRPRRLRARRVGGAGAVLAGQRAEPRRRARARLAEHGPRRREQARAREQAWGAAEQARAELSQGQDSLQAQMAAADRMRADLIGTVSPRVPHPAHRHPRGRPDAAQARRAARRPHPRRHAPGDPRRSRSGCRACWRTCWSPRPPRNVDPEASSAVDAVAAEVAMVVAAKRKTARRVGARRARAAGPHRPARRCTRCSRTCSTTPTSTAPPARRRSSPAAPTSAASGSPSATRAASSTSTRKGRLFEPFTQDDTGASRDTEGIGVGPVRRAPPRRGLRRLGRRPQRHRLGDRRGAPRVRRRLEPARAPSPSRLGRRRALAGRCRRGCRWRTSAPAAAPPSSSWRPPL